MSNLHGTLVAGDAVGSDYEIVGVAGSGGMGVVYRALDRRLGRTVALKFLPAVLRDSERERERFLQEARMASSLDHPNIGVIHAIEEIEGCGYIVMAYYDGPSLARHLQDGPLPQVEAVDIAMQMACGLAEAHARKIIHRDIKPSNVMLTSSGGIALSHVRIVDFGLAQVMAQSTATSSGAKGTLSYMSPEQAQEKHADERTDIWSLGVTLAEMLTGRNPFSRETIAATLLAILNERPAPLPGIHPGLQQIVYRALAKDVTARYQSIQEMLADLKRIRPELPIEAEMALSTELTRPIKAGHLAGTKRSRTPGLRNAMERASAPAVPLEYLRARKKKLHRLAYVFAALLAVCVSLVFVPSVRGWLADFSLPTPEKHIVVLPFENVSGDAGDSLLVAGLMNSLADRLSNLDADGQSLWVVPGSEVQRMKINDPADALKRLRATLVVRGSVNKHGQSVQLTVNLIDSRNLRQIGSIEVEDADGNLASLEAQAVAGLARLMKLKVPETSSVPLSMPAAYDSYLTALGYLQRYDKPGNLDLAIADLKNSIAIDPKFAVSYALLGEAYRKKSSLSKDPQWRADAEAFARKAIELNPEIASAYVTLGRLHTYKQPELAMQEFQHALAMDAHNADAVTGMAVIHEQEGRLPEAEAAYQRAIDLQPEDWTSYDHLGTFYDANRRYNEAFSTYRRALQLTPDNAEVMGNLAVAEINSGDPKLTTEAEWLLKRCIANNPTYQNAASLAVLYQQSGRIAEAATMTEKALAMNDRDEVVWANLVSCYELLQQHEKADRARLKAIVAAERALESNPQNASTHALLADEYAHSGHREQALAQIGSAEALAPEDPSVLANIADAYEGLGDRNRAIVAVAKAMQKGFTLEELKGDPEAKDLFAAVTKKQ